MSDTVPVKEITLEWAESFLGQFLPITFDSIGAATDFIKSYSGRYPKDGYDKVGFVITWADDNMYQGRMNCKHYSCRNHDTDIAAHIRGHVSYIANCAKEDNPYVSDSARENAVEFIQKYSLL
jgi:hypothetical protein